MHAWTCSSHRTLPRAILLSHLSWQMLSTHTNAFMNTSHITSTYHLDQTGIIHRDLFKSLDTDQSNTIEASELADGLKAQGYNISQQELAQLMGRVDFDRNGTLDIEEFISGLIDWTEVWKSLAPSQPNSRKSTSRALCTQQSLDRAECELMCCIMH